MGSKKRVPWLLKSILRPGKLACLVFLLLSPWLTQSAIISVVTTSDSGAGSLRQAILDANATNGLDTITFQIPGSGVHSIVPLSALPAITDSLVIDGTSQPGFAGTPLIELSGTSAGANAG